LRMLQRTDKTLARYALIQYCSNDFDENREFIDNGGKLPARDEAWFESQVEEDRSRRRYYLGKFTDSVLWLAWRRLGAPAERDVPTDVSNPDNPEQWQYLLNVIDRFASDLSGMTVIIFEMEFPADYRQANAARLQQRLADYQEQGRLRNVHIVDVMNGLGPEFFLPLDGHMNKLGHRRVAERLASVIH